MKNPIFYFIVVVIVSIIIVKWFFSKKAIIKRKLKKTEKKRIVEFKAGDVAKIVGKVEFVDAALIAPLSKRECAYYYIHVEQKVSSGKSSYWKTLVKEELSCRFVIREEDSCAYINDNNLKSYIVQDRNYSVGFMNDATENLEQYLHSRGHESEGFLGMNKTLRFNEGVLEKDEEIAVFGHGVWKDATQLKLPAEYGRILEITSPPNDAVYLSDDTDTTKKKVIKAHADSNDYNFEKRYKQNEKRYRE
ncbi:hypothetical protein [uncultured Draconibacterium sp.]|uniref:hypothetical protein n=1 Tax=uncultured Draconibacterium sp. TaxID=1573823 RepID=UPI0032179A73